MDDVAPTQLTAKTATAVPAVDTQASRKARPFLILLAFAVVAAAIGTGYVAMHAGKESTDDAQVEADVVALAPRIPGRIAHVLVHDNQRVHSGDVVVQLEDADTRAKADKAEAQLAIARADQRAAEAQELIAAAGARGGLDSAQAHLSSSRVDVSSADTQIDVARAMMGRAQADAQKSALELGRIASLRERGSATAEQLDNAKIGDESSRAALAQAQAALSAAEGQKRGAQTRVAEAAGRVTSSGAIDAQLEAARAHTDLTRARVKESEAALALARLELSYTNVLSPSDGMISKLNARVGQLVGAGQAIAELVPSESYVVANFKETQIAKMRPGDRVEIVLDAYPDHPLKGVVESLSAGTGARFSLLPPDNASGNFVKVVQRVPVRIAWEHPPELAIQVGLSAEATVDVSTAPR